MAYLNDKWIMNDLMNDKLIAEPYHHSVASYPLFFKF